MATPFDEVLRLIIKTEGGSDIGKLAQSIVELGKSGDVSEEELAGLVDEVVKLDQASKAAKSVISLSAAVQETGDRLFLARKNLTEFTAKIAESGDRSKSAAKGYQVAAKAVADLEAEEKRLDLALLKATGTVRKHGLDVENLAKADTVLRDRTKEAATTVATFATEAGKAATNTATLGKETDRLGRFFTSAREGVNNFAGSLLRITGIAGAVSTALAALGLGRLFTGAVQSATTFEAAMDEVRAVTGATTEQMERFRVAAEAASATTKFSALEAAGALGELARASGDADTAIAQLPATLNLAQAAGIGAAESAQILTTAITQFGLAGTDAARVADLFAREANSTQDTVSKLGLAMSYVAPLARQLGLSIEDTTATLGALAQEGFRGERAGTALRNVFSQLIDPSSNFRAALERLNITGNDFGGIIQQLAAKGDEGKRALLALDSEARPAIQALVNSGGAGLRALQVDLRNAAGEAERTAQVMGANFAGASSRFVNALDFLRRSLIAPVLEPLAKQFDDAAARVRAFVATADFQALAASIKDFAVSATAAIIEFVRSIDFKTVVASIKGFVDDAKGFFNDLRSNVDTVGTALSVVGKTIQTLFNGIQTIILGVAAATTAAFAMMLKGQLLAAEGIARLIGTYEGLRPAFDMAREKIEGLTAVAEEFAKRTGENARETAEAFGGLTSAVSDTETATKELADTTKQGAAAIVDYGAALEPLVGGLEMADAAIRGMNAGIAETAPKARTAAEALTALKLTSQADLQATAASAKRALDDVYAGFKAGEAAIEDVKRTFLAYSAAARAAAADSSDAVKQGVEQQIAAAAAAVGLADSLRDAGTAGTQAGQQTASAMRDVGAAATETAEKTEKAATTVSGALGGVLEKQVALQSGFYAISQAAGTAFNELSIRLFEVGAGVTFTSQALADGTGINRWAESMNAAADIVNARIVEQQDAARALGDQFDILGTEGANAFLAQAGGAEQALAGLEGLIAGIREGRSEYNLLGQEDLSRLISSAEAAAAKIRAIGEEADRAGERLRDLGDTLRDELDRNAGNEAAIEQRRFERQLAEIRELREIGGAANIAAAAEAERLAEQVHNANLRRIEEERRARAAAASGNAAGSGSQASQSAGSGGYNGGGIATPPAGTNATGARPAGVAGSPTLIFNINGIQSPSDYDRFIRKVRSDLATLQDRT